MRIKHVVLEPGIATAVKLPCKAGEILVKNFSSGDLLVSIEKEDFTEEYAKIPGMSAEVLNISETISASKSYFFDDVYLKSTLGGEVEIRCLKF